MPEPMRTRRQIRTRRRTYAVLAALLWLLGVEVLPNLHLATHGDATPHDHTAAGIVVTVSFEAAPHQHADGRVHAHAEPDPAKAHATRGRRHAGRLAVDLPADAHTATGLAHHALALHDAPPPELDPVPPTRTVTAVVTPVRGRASLDLHATPTARGPPAA